MEKEASGYDKDTPNCFGKMAYGEDDRGKMLPLGPNAGELMQGFALAIKAGVTKSDFDDLLGIHPTDAEAFVQMSVERRNVTEEADYYRVWWLWWWKVWLDYYHGIRLFY